MPNLTITPTPFCSSRLAIPPSPSSPQIPLSPPPSTQTHNPPPSSHRPQKTLCATPPPPEPLHWLWQCHLCWRIYQLGITRRCLDDGHYFCAGALVFKRDRCTGVMVRKKGMACASEFDYGGWKAWGVWRRSLSWGAESGMEVKPLFSGRGKDGGARRKDCWGKCDYPSECRWRKRYGATQSSAQADVVPLSTTTATTTTSSAAKTTTAAGKEAAAITAANTESPSPPKTKFEEILLTIPAPITEGVEVDLTSPTATVREGTGTGACATTTLGSDGAIKKPKFEDVLASAKPRKQLSTSTPPSPLASHPLPIGEEGSVDSGASRASSEVGESKDAGDVAPHSLQRALDELEVDVRKRFEKAGELWGGLIGGWNEEGRRERRRGKGKREDGETRSLSD